MSKRTQYSIAELQAVAEALPPKFCEWLRNEVFANRRYMFIHRIGRGKYQGYCSCGAADIQLEKVKAGQYTKCPVCGKTVRLRSENHPYIQDTDYVAYVQKTPWGYLSRLAYADFETSFSNNQVKERFRINEKQWDVLDWDGKERQYHFSFTYPYRDKPNLIRGRAPKAYGFYNSVYLEERSIWTYPHNLKALFKDDAKYKYSQIDLAAKHFWLNPIEYLLAYRSAPQLELLIKMGLYRLGHEYYLAKRGWYTYEGKFGVKLHAKNLYELCGLKDKQDIVYCIKHNFDKEEIEAYLKLKEEGAKIMPSLVQFSVAALHVRSRQGFRNNTLSIQNLYRYYLTQKKQYPIAINFLGDYGDYLRWCVDLRRDLRDTKNTKPKDFKYAHDMTLREIEEQQRIAQAKADKRRRAEQRKREKKKKEILQNLAPHYSELLDFSVKGMCIVVPTSPEEIRKEGELQGHCVGTYVDRVANGSSVIVFLRQSEAKDVPYYTIELDPLNDFKLVQCRGRRNCGYGDEVAKFLQQWQSAIQERLIKVKKIA